MSDVRDEHVADKVSLARRAWAHFYMKSPRRDSDYQPLFDLLDEDVVWEVAGLYETHGKQAVIEKFTSKDPAVEDNELEDPEGRPLEFVGDGDRVVMLGVQRYRIKKTGVVARNKEFAIVMEFHDGKIAHVREITDLSDWVAHTSSEAKAE